MLLRGIIATLLVAPLTSQAISITAGDVQASEKIKYMQHVSGTDHSRMAAFVQADQTFTQWCGRSASVADLKRISHQDGFIALYDRLNNGQAQGMTQTKTLLLNDNPKFCKG